MWLAQHGIGNEFGKPHACSVMVSVGDTVKQWAPQRHKVGWGVGHETPHRVRSSEVVNHGGPAKQAGPLECHGNTSGVDISPTFAFCESQPVVKQVDERQDVPLVGALPGETGAGGLGATEVGGTVCGPFVGTPRWRRIHPGAFGCGTRDVVGGCHPVMLGPVWG